MDEVKVIGPVNRYYYELYVHDLLSKGWELHGVALITELKPGIPMFSQVMMKKSSRFSWKRTGNVY